MKRAMVLLIGLTCAVATEDGLTARAEAQISADVMIKPRPLLQKKPYPPWPRRARLGVKLMPEWAYSLRPREMLKLGVTAQDLFELGLHPRELRALGIRPHGQGLRDLSLWPPEPKWPGVISAGQLAKALRQLCPIFIPAKRIRRYAEWITQYSAHFDVDPLLVSALIFQQSQCRARKENSWGVGLAMINPPMYRTRIRAGSFRFWVRNGDGWQKQRLAMNRFAYNRQHLHHAEANIYFAAGILAVYQRQCPDMDHGFGSVPHRHPVSHFIWGDQVRGAGPEDQILRARRRLIEYLSDTPRPARGRYKQLRLVSPLDGAPHKITSNLGDDRDNGRRQHTGLDFDSVKGEPVRAIAEGVVELAGVDRKQNRLRPLDPKLTRMVPPMRMGPRGLLVVVRHAGDLTSSYMHLSAYVVHTGQRVKAGEILGYVGRTGMRESEAHLHFGMRAKEQHLDPMVHLRPFLFPPEATYVGSNYKAHQRRRRKRREKNRRLGRRRGGGSRCRATKDRPCPRGTRAGMHPGGRPDKSPEKPPTRYPSARPF